MKRLNQRVAVVTGAARGIGQAIAVAFAVEGARLVLVDLADLRETTSLISRTASRTRPQLMRADVSSEGDAASVAEHALAEFGRIDILVNNAGILRRSRLADMPVAEWDRVIECNLRSVFLMCRYIIPSMLAARSGRLINIASQLGQIGGEERTHYSASKGGVIAFTRALAREVARDGVLVNAIAPGVIDTPMLAGESEAFRDLARGRIPLGRFGTPQEVASAAVFLASDEASLFVGQVLGLSGGEVMV